MRSRKLVAVVSPLLLGLAVLTGCGDNGDGDSAKPIESAAGGLSGEPIKIGQIAPTENAVYNTPDYIAVARAAVRGVNSRGGVNGRPLELVYCNDAFDPNKAAACARRLVDEGVVATVKSIIPQGGAQVSSILQEAGIPSVGLGALVPAEYQAPTSYLLDGGLSYPYAAAMIGAAEQGAKKVYLVTTDNASAGPFLAAMEAGARKLGMEVVGQQKLPVTTADYAPLVAAIQRSGADSALVALAQQGVVQSLRTADQNGVEAKWLLNSGTLTPEDYSELGSSVVENILHGSSVLPLAEADNNPQVKLMKEDLEAELAAGDEDADQKKLFGTSLLAWPSVVAVAELLKTAPTVDAAGLRTALDEARDLDLGVVPPWTPSASVSKASPRVSSAIVYLVKVEDGEPVLALPDPVDVSKILG